MKTKRVQLNVRVSPAMMAGLQAEAFDGNLNDVVTEIIAEGLHARKLGIPTGPRDVDRAARSIAETIEYRLVKFPGNDKPVRGLGAAMINDLAAHLATGIEEYGRGST